MENRIALLNHYSKQWEYRHSHYWKLVFAHVYTCILVILFPYFCERLGMDYPKILTETIFRYIGIGISVIFSYLIMCEGARLNSIRKTIKILILEIGRGRNYDKALCKLWMLPIVYVVPIVVLAFHVFVAIIYR